MGARHKTSHEDRILIRDLYRQGRTGVLTLKQIAARFGLSHETIRRIKDYDDIEMERFRQREEIRASRNQ